MTKTKRITIYTIANDLNISPSTVSKVVNNSGNVSIATRERVLKHIKKVGYVPSTSARMLKSKSTRSIGIVFTEELDIGLEHSFFSSILQHFKNYVELKGYDISFIVPKIGNNRMSYYQWCLNKRVDGVYIVVGDYNDEDIYELVDSEIPTVSTDMILNNLHTVISDNKDGVKTTLDYIQNDLKLQRVAAIVGPQHSKAFEERYQVLMKLIGNYNLVLKEEHIVMSQGFGFTSGYNAMIEILNSGIDYPEIVMVASDDIAVGVLKALKDRNIDVPNDIQVIGFDDVPISKYLTPALTTISQDRKSLGEEAAKLLLTLIEEPESNPDKIKRIPISLIERESTIKK